MIKSLIDWDPYKPFTIGFDSLLDRLTSIPMDLYQSSENFTVTWVENGFPYSSVAGTLCLSNSSGGGELANYTATTANGNGSLTTKPSTIGYGVGLYYAVIGDPVTGDISQEFQIIVESGNSVQMTYPTGGVELETTTPIFIWNPTPGVPYYHLILSDNPFNLSEDENGNMTVSGAQAIWAIITSETSAQYGIIDPSGTINNNPPPLIDGLEYNWLVMNNYGNDFLYSSTVVGNPASFTYKAEVHLDNPEQIYPAFSTSSDPAIIEGEDIIPPSLEAETPQSPSTESPHAPQQSLPVSEPQALSSLVFRQ